MKIPLLMIFLISFCASTIYTQKYSSKAWGIGGSGGINNSNYSEGESEANTGYFFGAGSRYRFNKQFGISTNLNYVAHNFTNGFSQIEFNYNIQSIELDLNFDTFFPIRKSNMTMLPRLYLGFALCYNSMFIEFEDSPWGGEFNSINSTSKFEYGVIAGIGFGMQVRGIEIGINSKYLICMIFDEVDGYLNSLSFGLYFIKEFSLGGFFEGNYGSSNTGSTDDGIWD